MVLTVYNFIFKIEFYTNDNEIWHLPKQRPFLLFFFLQSQVVDIFFFFLSNIDRNPWWEERRKLCNRLLSKLSSISNSHLDNSNLKKLKKKFCHSLTLSKLINNDLSIHFVQIILLKKLGLLRKKKNSWKDTLKVTANRR